MKKKIAILLAALVVMSVSVTCGVWAMLKDKTEPVSNSFYLKPEIEIEEKVEGNKKEYAKVVVKSHSCPLAVRAQVVFTLVDKDNNVIPREPVAYDPVKAPTNYDYSINWNTEGWHKDADGFWYCYEAVDKDHDSPNLFTDCVTNNTEYTLNVDIIAQAIEGNDEAIKDAWGK